MYKLTVTSRHDKITRTFIRTHSNHAPFFVNEELVDDIDPEIFMDHDDVYDSVEALKAIAREALDHGDAPQLEPIEVEA